MAVNPSSKEKTVMDMYKTLSSDTWSRDRELYYGKYSNDIVVSTKNLMSNFHDYFSQFLVEADVPEKYYYQPAAFAEKYYGTPDLDYLVLYFADMKSLFEFKIPKIKMLPRTKLVEYNKLLTTYKDEISGSYKNPESLI